MPDSHWENLKELFHAALALPQPDRATYLDQACNGDVELRRAVESLLRSHEETGNFVDLPAYQAAAEMYLTKQRLAIGSSVSSIGKLKDVSITYTAGLGRSAFFFIKSPFICS